MTNNFDAVQNTGKEFMDRSAQSLGAMSKGMQAIAAEMADYSKASFEDGTSAMEKVIGAKSLDKAIEAQSEYVRASYEQFVARMGKISELYVDLARDAYKPFEAVAAKGR